MKLSMQSTLGSDVLRRDGEPSGQRQDLSRSGGGIAIHHPRYEALEARVEERGRFRFSALIQRYKRARDRFQSGVHVRTQRAARIRCEILLDFSRMTSAEKQTADAVGGGNVAQPSRLRVREASPPRVPSRFTWWQCRRGRRTLGVR